MKILIKNATTTPYLMGRKEEGETLVNVVVEQQRVLQVSEAAVDGDFDQVIDATGLFLSPGLIDPQVHFREPGMEYKEDIESGSKAAVKGGFTAVISMPNTSPTADNPEVVQFMVDKAKSAGLCKVYPTGALSLGLKGETLCDYEALKQAGAIAITDDGKGVQDDNLFEQALINAKMSGLPVLDHSEDESLSAQGAIHAGEIAKKYGVKGIKPESESVHVKRGCEMSEKTGAHYHVLHVSTKDSIDAIRAAKLKGIKVTAEVSPHHLLLCDEDIKVKEDGTLDANWKMNPPLRSSEDRAACQAALLDGTIDAVATDHAPHSPDEKAMDIESAPFGIIGLETSFPLLYTHFVKTKKLSLNQCIDLMSKQAGGLFGLNCGRILEGTKADLVLLDLKQEFTVDEDYFASKSVNSPFINDSLFGRPRLTMVEGKVVFNEM